MGIMLSLAFAATVANRPIQPNLIPWPKEIRVAPTTLALPKGTTVVARQAALKPLVRLVVDQTETVFDAGWRAGTGGEGKIVLAIDPKLKEEEYRLQIAEGVRVTGGSYQAVAMGTVTLFQALRADLTVDRMEVRDAPASGYRGVLLDVARRYHSVPVLKQCVELCRFYKIRYLQLHLTDDQAFTFPSRAFPKLTTVNTHGGPSYTLAELKDLVRFADERGVTIIPEMDIPGHSGALIRAMPDLFKIAGTKPYEHHATLNFANERAIAAVDTLVGEMCEVFRSAPYFHMGGDEADISNAHEHPDFQAAFAKHGLSGKAQHEIFRLFILRVNEMVKRRGKRLIVWEGFGRERDTKFPIPKDVLLMEFESSYYLPTDMIADGYEVVNAAWTPLYVVNRHVWPMRKVYEWDVTRFGKHTTVYPTAVWFDLPSTKGIVGAQVCAWEAPETLAIQNFRGVVPAMAERVWNPGAGRPFEDFKTRHESVDARLDRLIHPVRIVTGRLNPKGEHDFDVPTFTDPLPVRLSAPAGHAIHYTLDGTPPTRQSPVYEGPLLLKETTTVRAIAAGHLNGYATAGTFYYAPPKRPNLATGRKVTVSGGTEGPQTPELAVDDDLSLGSSWWAMPGPQWLQVDLGEAKSVGRVEVYPYWDGSRYYAYTVEVSVDAKTWTTVADRSTNTLPANPSGDTITFPPRPVRYVRVNMLKGSANPGVHLVELKVWP
ncbi:MAG: family 20 glycosylhydrolase [Fimbriimonas sp.]